MRYALLADIHGNIEALDAVLKDMDKLKPFDKIVVLGDTIGYGPNPRECLEKVFDIADLILIGNHEKETVLPEKDEMCSDVMEMLEYTAKQLEGLPAWETLKKSITPEDYKKLALNEDNVRLFVHGSPKRPVVQYVWSGHHLDYIVLNNQIDKRLMEHLAEFEKGHCFCGHTHIPYVITAYENRGMFDQVEWNRKSTFIGPNTILFVPNGTAAIEGLEGKKAIINPGSIGQPRDDNPDASYAVYSGDKIQFRRIPYDFEKTQKKLMALPISDETKEFFAGRLAKGN